jgi:hypothetical protein
MNGAMWTIGGVATAAGDQPEQTDDAPFSPNGTATKRLAASPSVAPSPAHHPRPPEGWRRGWPGAR